VHLHVISADNGMLRTPRVLADELLNCVTANDAEGGSRNPALAEHTAQQNLRHCGMPRQGGHDANLDPR
jgi:hypothetical protein